MIYGYNRIWQLIENRNIELENEALEQYKEKKGQPDDFVSGCNCDLRIGDGCYLSDSYLKHNLHSLKLRRKAVIQPMGIMQFETEAVLHIPTTCAFRLSLRMRYFKKGLFMPNLPLGQPGYNGRLYGVLINISNKPIKIRYRERMFTLEIIGIEDSQIWSLDPINTKAPLQGSMREFSAESINTSFREEIERAERSSKRLTRQRKLFSRTIQRHTRFQMIMLSLGTVLLTALTVIVALITGGKLFK